MVAAIRHGVTFPENPVLAETAFPCVGLAHGRWQQPLRGSDQLNGADNAGKSRPEDLYLNVTVVGVTSWSDLHSRLAPSISTVCQGSSDDNNIDDDDDACAVALYTSVETWVSDVCADLSVLEDVSSDPASPLQRPRVCEGTASLRLSGEAGGLLQDYEVSVFVSGLSSPRRLSRDHVRGALRPRLEVQIRSGCLQLQPHSSMDAAQWAAWCPLVLLNEAVSWVMQTCPHFVEVLHDFPCRNLDFQNLPLYVMLDNGDTVPFYLPMGKLPLSFAALEAQLRPQFVELCGSISNRLGSVENCASGVQARLEKLVSSLCSQAFDGIPPTKPPMFITLGSSCAAPLVLQRANIRTISSPFDWHVTPLRTVLSVLRGEVTSLTDDLRESREADIEEKYLKLNASRYLNKPFSPRLQTLFVHDDDYSAVHADPLPFDAKYDRRQQRMMFAIKSPPPEGVHLIYHIPKELPLREALHDGFTEREATASAQQLKELFEGRDGVQISPLMEVMPILAFWCSEFFERQHRLWRVLLARGIPLHANWLGNGTFDDQSEHLGRLVADRHDNTCGWMHDPYQVKQWESLWS